MESIPPTSTNDALDLHPDEVGILSDDEGEFRSVLSMMYFGGVTRTEVHPDQLSSGYEDHTVTNSAASFSQDGIIANTDDSQDSLANFTQGTASIPELASREATTESPRPRGRKRKTKTDSGDENSVQCRNGPRKSPTLPKNTRTATWFCANRAENAFAFYPKTNMFAFIFDVTEAVEFERRRNLLICPDTLIQMTLTQKTEDFVGIGSSIVGGSVVGNPFVKFRSSTHYSTIQTVLNTNVDTIRSAEIRRANQHPKREQFVLGTRSLLATSVDLHNAEWGDLAKRTGDRFWTGDRQFPFQGRVTVKGIVADPGTVSRILTEEGTGAAS